MPLRFARLVMASMRSVIGACLPSPGRWRRPLAWRPSYRRPARGPAPQWERHERVGRSVVLAQGPEPTGALLEVADRLEERLAREVRPEDGREPQLGVRDLPQQEVRDALLA